MQDKDTEKNNYDPIDGKARIIPTKENGKRCLKIERNEGTQKLKKRHYYWAICDTEKSPSINEFKPGNCFYYPERNDLGRYLHGIITCDNKAGQLTAVHLISEEDFDSSESQDRINILQQSIDTSDSSLSESNSDQELEQSSDFDINSSRIPLPTDNTYSLKLKNNTDEISVIILDLISNSGGSCLVYKGNKPEIVNGEAVPHTVIVKEFYPKKLGVKRNPDYSLSIPEIHKNDFIAYQKQFGEGQRYHAFLTEKAFDTITLPRMMFFGEANGTVYSVSEPADGKTLSEINHSKLSLNQIGSIMGSVCKGISYIHRDAHVLLDCKPDNFFYDGSKRDIETKTYLFDFDTVASISSLKAGKAHICSYSEGWAAPEQIPTGSLNEYKNPRDISYHTDIYAIGLLFFWLLTNHSPSEEEINLIANGSFDWEKNSPVCSEEDKSIIKRIQDIEKRTLEHSVGKRKKDFPNSNSINELKDDFDSIFKEASDENHPLGYSNKNTDEIKKEVRELKNQNEQLKHFITNNSFVSMVFGSKRRIAISICILIIASLIFGIISSTGAKAVDQLVSSNTTIEDDMDNHVLLKLNNANHQYEVGIENWRRLDYFRAERDILESRNSISEEVSQSDIEVAKINNSLGCLYLDMGRYSEAYDYLNSAYVTFRDLLGEKSIEARAARSSIAHYYFSIGKLDEAFSEIQYIIDNSDTNNEKAIIASASHLKAMVYDAQGKYDDALALYEEVLDLYSDIAKDGKMQKQLANYANDPNLNQSQKDYYTNSIKWIIATYNNIAKVNNHKGDYQNAIKAAETGIDMSLSNIYIGRRNLTTSHLYTNLAIAQGNSNSLNDALDNIDLAMRIQRNLFDFQDVFPGLVEVYDSYGNLLLLKGKNNEAKEYYDDAVALARNSFSENHPETARALHTLGRYFLSYDSKTAVDLLSQSIEIRKNILAENHPETATIYYDLYKAQYDAGLIDNAIESLEKAKEICKKQNMEGSIADQINNTLIVPASVF